MKKLTLFLSLLLMGCSSVITNSQPVENTNEIKHVCVKQTKSAVFAKALSESLNKRNISTEIYQGQPPLSCEYLLAYSLVEEDLVALRAKIRLSSKSEGKALGEISYKQRGEEKEKVKKTGVRGQTDLMINELFKK